jgi:two-component system, chemotaxis family, chemotaxis protein CheY
MSGMAKVLLVEDECLVRRVLVLMVSRAGHETREASSVHEAAEEARTFNPDVLLLDWNLPDGTGVEVANEVVSAHPSVKLVFLSAYSPAMLREETRHLHPAAILQKPASMKHITEAVGPV